MLTVELRERFCLQPTGDGAFTPEGFLWRGRVVFRPLEDHALLVEVAPELFHHPFHQPALEQLAGALAEQPQRFRRLPRGFCLESEECVPCEACQGPALKQCLVCGAKRRGGWWPF